MKYNNLSILTDVYLTFSSHEGDLRDLLPSLR